MADSLHRIVLTGGPCAGKTTALAKLTDRLNSLGYKVFRVPEAATILIQGGVRPANIHSIEFQSTVMHLQMGLEDAISRVAQGQPGRAVMLCDRGLMDSAAYVDQTTFPLILDQNKWSRVGIRDERYDAVVHLVTAAMGAGAFYTTANNSARTESPEKAIELDALTQCAWVGHPHVRVIDNSTEFSEKITRAMEAIARVLGIPEPV